MKELHSGEWSPGMSGQEKKTLFDIARDTLKWCVSGQAGGSFSFKDYELTEKLKVDMATFVTLKFDGRLRGCIGSLQPVEPLYKSLHHNTINAAMNDPRFRPIRKEDVGDIDIHVSILSPILSISSLDEFKLGEHGIILEKGGARAVFLPEVATEQGWTEEQTLSQLSQKAGLDPDAWREGAGFKIFSSVVLSEN